MPGKSRHRKGKHPLQSKKKKGRLSRPNIFAQQAAVAQTREPVSSPNVSVPSASIPTPMAKPAAVRHPYIATELWTIGVLAAIMLTVLAVLASVLS